MFTLIASMALAVGAATPDPNLIREVREACATLPELQGQQGLGPLAAYFDFAAMGEAALGDARQDFAEDQLRRFRGLFVAVMEHRLRAKRLCDAVTRDGSEVELFSERGSEPSSPMPRRTPMVRAVDLRIDGQTTIDAYREQFRRVIFHHGVEGLLDRLGAQLERSCEEAPTHHGVTRSDVQVPVLLPAWPPLAFWGF